LDDEAAMTTLELTRKTGKNLEKTPINPKALYRSIMLRRAACIACCLIAMVLLFLINLATGSAMIPLRDVALALTHPSRCDEQTLTIVREMRLPIAAMALLIGGSLAAAGAEMQTILDNPLASPFTLGISAAAALGASVGIVFGVGVFPHVSPLVIIPLNAFVFALGSAAVIFGIAKIKQGSSQTIILAGIAMVFLFDAVMSLLRYMAKDDQLQAMTYWSFGSLEGATIQQASIVGISLLIGFLLLFANSWKLTALTMGDAKAKSMGIDTGKIRLAVLLIVSFITAVSVCFVGTIGFIGLVSPHVARWIVGEDQRYFLPASILFGAIFLTSATIAGKILIPGTVLPIGITTSLVGVPFLLALIFKNKQRGY
jgi:iron complex transport system permease protein